MLPQPENIRSAQQHEQERKWLMKIKLSAIIIACAAVISSFPAAAAENTVKLSAENCLAIHGEEVCVSFGVSSNNGFSGFSAEITYDPAILDFRSAKPGAMLSGASFYCTNTAPGKLSVVWADSKDRTISTRLMCIYFDALENAGDMTSPVKISAIDMADSKHKRCEVKADTPLVMVTEDVQTGDVDRNGSVGLTDLVRLCRYIADPSSCPLSNTAYANGDVTGDSRISGADCVQLLKTVSGGGV